MGEECRDCSKWEEDIYWTHFQSIMFFQVLPQGFDKQLAIPEKFARNIKQKLPENVTVIGPSGAKWNVGLVSNGKTFLFKHGWKEFVQGHSLEEDDVLIFRYNGESRFDVLIFSGQSFCERESSYFFRKCGHGELNGGFRSKRPAEVGHDLSDSEVGHDLSDGEVGRDLSDSEVGNTQSKRAKNDENLKSACLGRLTQSRTRLGANNVMHHHGNHVGVRKVHSVAKDGSVGSYHLQYVSNRRPVTAAEIENALQMARAASTPDSVLVVMRASHVYRGFYMSIPSEWVLSHLPHKSQNVFLRVKERGNGRNAWRARYFCRASGSSRVGALTNGWKDFAFDNNLEEFDVCLFELASGTHDEILMDVSIFRVVAEVSPLTRVVSSPSKRRGGSKHPRKRKKGSGS